MTDTFTPQMLRLERLLDAPVETVWQFLVDPEKRARWFMGGPTRLEVGGTIGMIMDHDRLSDAPVPTPEAYRAHVGQSWDETITRLDPPHLLAFTWSGGKDGEVTFQLSEADDRTRLILTHTGIGARADAVNFGGGWHSHLTVLERRLRGNPVPDFWALHAVAEAAANRALG
jgi:uncharacterized protein YndB with AHSA1/START domain